MSNIFKSNKKIKGVYVGNVPLKHGYKFIEELQEVKRIYSASNLVTYHVDSNVQYQEDIDNGETVLSPTSFTPTKEGYIFLGWRENNLPVDSVLTEKLMEDDNIDLYAVFTRDVTLTLYNNTDVDTDTKHITYNNGRYDNPIFYLAANSKDTFSVYGWSDSATEIKKDFDDKSHVVLSEDATYYACYKRTVKVRYNGNGSTSGSISDSTGTAYFHSLAGYTNASIRLANGGFTRVNYKFNGWDITSPYVGYQDVTVYAQWLESNPTVFTKGSPTEDPTYNSKYVNIDNFIDNHSDAHPGNIGASIWYVNGSDTQEGSLDINFNEYDNATVIFGIDISNVANFLGSTKPKDVTGWINGDRIVYTYGEGWYNLKCPNEYTVKVQKDSTGKVTIPAKAYVWQDVDMREELKRTWCYLNIYIKEIKLS